VKPDPTGSGKNPKQNAASLPCSWHSGRGFFYGQRRKQVLLITISGIAEWLLLDFWMQIGPNC
jgi:hypothetical protein